MVTSIDFRTEKLYVNELKEQAHGVFDHQLPTLPTNFVDLLPSNCPSCNTPLVITPTYSRLSCPSLSCGGKAVQRLLGLINDIGVLNMGESKCRKFFEYYGLQNPYAIFAVVPIEEDGSPAPDGRDILGIGISHKVTVDIYRQVQERNRMSLWEYVRIGNYPAIRDRALALFGAYDSLDAFYKEFEHGDEKGRTGIAFVQAKLGISNTTFSISAVEITDTLQRAKSELYEFIEDVNIIPLKAKQIDAETGEILRVVEKPVYNICISRAVGAPFRTKQDFVHSLKNGFYEYVQINVLGGVTAICNVLIWSGIGAPTTKVKDADRINKRAIANGEEPPVKIMTGQEFIDELNDYIAEQTEGATYAN